MRISKNISRSSLLRTAALFPAIIVVAAAYQPNNISPSDKQPIMKAWHCHGRSQRELVDRLRQARIVKSAAVQQVMEQVDRKFYVGGDLANSQDNGPYLDTPLGIGQKQTISAPHMHAHALEEMLPAIRRNAAAINDKQHGVKVLDVGCGSGYLTACLGRWFHARREDGKATSSTSSSSPSILPYPGKVFGMDIHTDLVQFTTENIQKNDADLLESHTIRLQHGNGWLGWPEEAPFDAIHVGAAAATFPFNLAMQLSMHGVLIVPVGPQGDNQVLIKVERVAQSSNNDFSWDDFHVSQLLGVRYVPLVERPE